MAVIEKIYVKKNDIWNQEEKLDLHTCELKEGKRSVSFISSEGNNRLIDDSIKGFCHIKFRANIVIDGINVEDLTKGELLQIGGAIIKITEVGKECYDDCPIVKKFNILCSVNKQIFFGEVLKAGIIKKRDSIIFLSP